jgi:signal transduction histidine kinase
VALPLRLGDRILGVLDVQSTDEEGVDEDDVSVLQNVAHQITIALENARAYAVEREAVERLKELDLSKRRFLANMSYELRTPLTNILGFSRLMMKEISGPITEQQRDDLQIVYQDSQHLLGLINDLLDISHIEAGLMELEFQKVDLGQLIHSVMATASALVRDKNVELHQEIAPDMPEVSVDVARIRQVLLRLLANAAKFTEQGSITVRAWPDDGQVLVSVSDTGVGIPTEDQERIFERFEQGTLENGRRPDGAGLGLALSKQFVEMHGGRIWVESEVGKGATFTFSLPLRRG